MNRVLSAEKEDLPDNYGLGAEYEYNPRPPKAPSPLISRNEFKLCLTACSEGCIKRFFVPWHDCYRLPPECRRLSRIPKKKTQFDLISGIGCGEVAFGLEADYNVSFLYVLIYHMLLIIPAIGFWVFWLLNHPGDLQNASVPFFTVLSITGLFWATYAKELGSAAR